MWMLLLLTLWLLLFLWLDGGIAEGSPEPDSATIPTQAAVDVIVPFRNEAGHLEQLLKDLYTSVHPNRALHLILVDDHSSDHGSRMIESVRGLAPENVSISLLNTDIPGKKRALMVGLDRSEAPWVFLTDADCRLPHGHIERLLMLAERDASEVVFTPVLFQGNGLFSTLQSLENFNTQAVTEAFLSKGKPMMVNGANILFRSKVKDIYLRSQHWGYPGGDDVFFAQALTRAQYTFCYTKRYAVTTATETNWRAFFNQRMRWVSKARSYPERIHLAFTALYGLLSLGFIGVFIQAILAGSIWNTAWLVLVAKWIIDRSFHQSWARKYAMAIPLGAHILLSWSYPFYSLMLGVLSFIPLRFDWKGRTYSNKPATEASV